MIDEIKGVIAGIFIAMLSYFAPLKGELSILMAIFSLNFAAGYFVDILVNNGHFSFIKSWHAVEEVAVFVIIVATLYYIGEHKKRGPEALACVSFVTYSVVYFYSLNILRNLKQLFVPGSVGGNVVSFLYYVMSFEAIKKIPFLSNYVNNIGK